MKLCETLVFIAYCMFLFPGFCHDPGFSGIFDISIFADLRFQLMSFKDLFFISHGHSATRCGTSWRVKPCVLNATQMQTSEYGGDG